MAGGMYEKELEEMLMPFTAKFPEQNDVALKQNIAMKNNPISVKEHAEKKSTIAQTNLRNEASKGNKDTSAPLKGTIFLREIGDKPMKPIVNLVEQTKEAIENPGGVADVDILGGPRIAGYRLIEAEPIATTESSSSFSSSADSRDELSDAFGESEATSTLRGNSESIVSEFNRFADLSRMRTKRKKVSSQWKSRIHSVEWRLKWAELQMKMLNALAEGYDRKLEDCNKLKQIRLDRSQFGNGDTTAREIPFSRVKDANHVLRRKKRKRDESSGDFAKYMSQHNLFSYYSTNSGRKNVPPFQVSAPKFIKEEESVVCSEQLHKEFQNGDNSLEHTIQKILDIQSKSAEMKGRIEKIFGDSFCTFLGPSSIGTYITAQLISEYSLNDNLAPEDEAEAHENMVPPGVRCNGGGDIIGRLGVKEEPEEVEARQAQVLRPLEIRGETVIRNSSSTQMECDANLDDQKPKKVGSVAKLTGPRSKRTRRRGSSKRGGK